MFKGRRQIANKGTNSYTSTPATPAGIYSGLEQEGYWVLFFIVYTLSIYLMNFSHFHTYFIPIFLSLELYFCQISLPHIFMPSFCIWPVTSEFLDWAWVGDHLLEREQLISGCNLQPLLQQYLIASVRVEPHIVDIIADHHSYSKITDTMAVPCPGTSLLEKFYLNRPVRGGLNCVQAETRVTTQRCGR